MALQNNIFSGQSFNRAFDHIVSSGVMKCDPTKLQFAFVSIIKAFQTDKYINTLYVHNTNYIIEFVQNSSHPHSCTRLYRLYPNIPILNICKRHSFGVLFKHKRKTIAYYPYIEKPIHNNTRKCSRKQQQQTRNYIRIQIEIKKARIYCVTMARSCICFGGVGCHLLFR